MLSPNLSHPDAAVPWTDWANLLHLREQWRASNQVVVWTSGCFDILHAGHMRSLQAARRLGDVLVVGLNSDRSVARLKGPSRPIFAETERAELLSGLRCVDYVLIFDEDTPSESLARLKPDIHCKGEDYAPPHGKPIPEAEVVRGYGGRVAFLPLSPDLSSSAIMLRIQRHTVQAIS